MVAVTGHVRLVHRKRGDKWYAKWRGRDGRHGQKCLGTAWTERSRPPAGYFTRKLAEEWLQEKLVSERISIAGCASATNASRSSQPIAAYAASITSTFSCDIAYSRRPAASRASASS